MYLTKLLYSASLMRRPLLVLVLCVTQHVTYADDGEQPSAPQLSDGGNSSDIPKIQVDGHRDRSSGDIPRVDYIPSVIITGHREHGGSGHASNSPATAASAAPRSDDNSSPTG